MTRRIFLASRSLIRKVPSLSVTRPHGASRSETISGREDHRATGRRWELDCWPLGYWDLDLARVLS